MYRQRLALDAAAPALLFAMYALGLVPGLLRRWRLSCSGFRSSHSVQRLARPEARGGITGLYYVLTYLGFAAPYLVALATRLTTPVVALELTAAAAATIAISPPRSGS